MFPYNRIVVWAAGPISILAGWIATQLVQHVGLFGPLGLGQDKIAHAIVVAVTFAVSAAVTYAAHHKWLDNLVKLTGLGVTPVQSGTETPVQPASLAAVPTPTPGAPTA